MDIYRVTITNRKSGRTHHRLWLGYQSAMNCFHYWRNVVWRQRDAEGKEEMHHPYRVTWEKISTVDSDWTPVNVATEREVRRLLDLWTRMDETQRDRVRRELNGEATAPAVVVLEEQPQVLSAQEKREAFLRLGAGGTING